MSNATTQSVKQSVKQTARSKSAKTGGRVTGKTRSRKKSSVAFLGSTDLSDMVRLQLYSQMLLSRRLDDAEMQLKRQNIVFFQISGAGHEASQCAAALHLKGGHDWFFPYYRDRALCLGIGVTPTEMFLQSVGAAADPASGGRQMPSHWGHVDHNLVSQSSPTGTQFLQAVGCAEAGVRAAKIGGAAEQKVGPKAGEVVYVSAGEGTTSEGEFAEALNAACLEKLPVLFHIEDNGYAISVPKEEQTAGGCITALTAGYPGLLRLHFDGCDPEASYHAWAEGVAYARAGKGPVLMHAEVMRAYSHSMSDDDRLYRTKKEITEDQKRDPIPNYRTHLLSLQGISEQQLTEIETKVDAAVNEAMENARDAALADPDTVERFVYCENNNPESDLFKSEPQYQSQQNQLNPEAKKSKEAKALPNRTLIDSVNDCLRDEMRRNKAIVVFGEDVADASREIAMEEVKGKGGVFKATHGLQREFGSDRVFNSPLAEANIVGRAIGMALRGLKPVVEIQFFDYIFPAYMQIRSELATMRWRSNNTFSCPVVIRSTYGGYLKGGAVFHSQTGESVFTHIPGLRVVMPSNAQDAAGLLRTAIRCDDPVLFLEHKHLYRQTYNRAPYAGPDYTIPFAQANRLQEGDDLTIITYGALVKRSQDAIRKAKELGLSIELLDLRTISPYDWESIAKSIKKTNRALVVYEDCLSWGSGSEIAARIADELFDWLDAPVKRVASLDTFVGYQPLLEDRILPQANDVLKAIIDIIKY